MTRAALILIAVFLVMGAQGFQNYYSHRVTVVYAVRDIEEGGTLAAKDMEERIVNSEKFNSPMLLFKKKSGIGRMLQNRVVKGKPITRFDLKIELRGAVICKEFIGKGQIVRKEQVEQVLANDADPRLEEGTYREPKYVIGQRANVDIQAGDFLSIRHFW